MTSEPITMEGLAERIAGDLFFEPNTGCHLYGGLLNRGGYGRLWVDGREHRVHRLMLEARLGRRLPADVLACHSCDVRACCNPDHLFAGSVSDNNADRAAKGRSPRVPNGGKRLGPDDIAQIRAAKDAGEASAVIAVRFGVSCRYVMKLCEQRDARPDLCVGCSARRRRDGRATCSFCADRMRRYYQSRRQRAE